RLGDPLHLTAGLLDMGEDDARVLMLLTHSAEGAPAAVIQTQVRHAAVTDGRRFAWPRSALARAESLRVRLPDGLGPRSLTPGAAVGEASLADAESAGLVRYGAGAFGPGHCDVFGRVAADQLMARLADGAAQGIGVTRAAAGDSLGLAVVEYRIVYLDSPRAGDRFVVRAGLARADPRRLEWSYWMFDPDTGAPRACARSVLVPFDLEARKAMTLPGDAVARLRERVIQF
ncbi:MAG TPA: acyl-CoA thioesterase, partial [Caulobacteraceae bacterium]